MHCACLQSRARKWLAWRVTTKKAKMNAAAAAAAHLARAEAVAASAQAANSKPRRVGKLFYRHSLT